MSFSTLAAGGCVLKDMAASQANCHAFSSPSGGGCFLKGMSPPVEDSERYGSSLQLK